MIARMIETLLLRRLKSNPAAVLVGPRQSGKTTLARSLSSSYFDLEQPADRLRLDPQWSGLVAGHRLMILDEAQTWPELFPACAPPSTRIGADRRYLVAQVAQPSLSDTCGVLSLSHLLDLLEREF